MTKEELIRNINSIVKEINTIYQNHTEWLPYYDEKGDVIMDKKILKDLDRCFLLENQYFELVHQLNELKQLERMN